MTPTEVPEPWASHFIRAGYVDGRYSKPVASFSALAKRVGCHTSTLVRVLTKGGEVRDPELIPRIARELGLPLNEVVRLLGSEQQGAGPWAPPGSEFLTDHEKRALSVIVRSMVNDRTRSDLPPDLFDLAAREQAGEPSLEIAVQLAADTRNKRPRLEGIRDEQDEHGESGGA